MFLKIIAAGFSHEILRFTDIMYEQFEPDVMCICVYVTLYMSSIAMQLNICIYVCKYVCHDISPGVCLTEITEVKKVGHKSKNFMFLEQLVCHT